MSALLFREVLAAVQGGRASAECDACTTALRADARIADLCELPTLRRLAAEATGETQGQLVFRVLRLSGPPSRLYAAATMVAPRAFPNSLQGTAEGQRRALRLHADCYLALGEFVTSWNRNQIKRVA